MYIYVYTESTNVHIINEYIIYIKIILLIERTITCILHADVQVSF